MRVGVTVRIDHPREFAELAELAEAVGLESIWRGEHVIRPMEGFHGYPYGSGDHLSTYAVFDPLQLAASAGVTTERITIGVGVLILPLWEPLLLARSLRTAALACDGRLAVGVGVGWSEPEFRIAGRSFGERGRNTDSTLELLSAAMDTGVFDGPDGMGRLFDARLGEPATPAIELVIGGDSPPALQRAKRFGGGWYGHFEDTETLRRRLGTLDEAPRRPIGGFAPGKRTVRVELGTSADEIRSLGPLGVERIIVPLVGSHDPRAGVRAAAELQQRLT